MIFVFVGTTPLLLILKPKKYQTVGYGKTMNPPTVRKTGGYIDDMTMSLIEAACDRDVDVQNIIRASLENIGRKQPLLFLSSCTFYLSTHVEVSQGHKGLLLRAMERVINDTINVISEDVAIEVLHQIFTELPYAKTPDCQAAAVDVIGCLYCKFYHEVMNELLDKFQPGVMPHYVVVQTLAKLALINVPASMPYLKACLGTCLTLLTTTRSNDMKCAFSKLLANFSEAIVEYKYSIITNSDPIIPEDYFVEDLGVAWDILFNSWLSSKDLKVKCAVVECLGKMSFVIASELLREFLPRLIPEIYSLYKKQLRANVVSEALFHVIKASSSIDPALVEPFIDGLMGVLFPQACVPVDLLSSSSVKNHNEILKSFLELAKFFPERVMFFVLVKLETVNEKCRIASLDIIHHLVNYKGDIFREKQKNILNSLKMVTCDISNKVKRKLAEVIIGIAHHGYLELDGGKSLIEFIVKQCVLPSANENSLKKFDDEYMDNNGLKLFCENVLHHLSTSVPGISGILWPYLLTFLTLEPFTAACGILCKTISIIAYSKLESNDPDYYINFEREVDVPRPSSLFVRLIVLLRYPLKGLERGLHIIEVLIALSKLIRPADPQWEASLIQSRSGKGVADASNDALWEVRLLEILRCCLQELDEDDWPTICGEDFIRQVPLYQNYPEEKIFLLKCIGVAGSKSCKTKFVIQAIDSLFSVTHHAIENEREACAQAIGSLAVSHAELVINKLNTINKSMKVSSLINFFKEAIGDIDEKMKATLILSYGYVALYAPSSFLQSHLDSSIVIIVNQNICQVKDAAARNSIVRTMELIGDAASKHKESILSSSNQSSLFIHLQNLMKQESQTLLVNSTRSLIIRASISLLVEVTDETINAFSLMVSRIICLPPDAISTISSHQAVPIDEQLRYSKLLSVCLEDLKNYACILMTKKTTPDMFLIIFNVLKPIMVSAHECQRTRGILIFSEVAKIFHLHINVALVNHMPSLGEIIATMIPRCSDQSITVRLLALDCIKNLLKLGLRYEGRSPNYQDDVIDGVDKLKTSVVKVDTVTMFAAINDLSKILNKKVNGDHLFSYIEGLLSGLTDLQLHCSSAAGLALINCIKHKGSEFYGMVGKVFIALIQKIPEIKHPQARTSSLRAVRFLTFHHLLKVVSLLLEEAIPLSDLTKEIWRSLGQDLQTTPSILEHLLDMLTQSQPFEDHFDLKRNDKPVRRALAHPLAIVSALTEMMKSEECQITVLQIYPQLLTQMLAQVASMTSVRSPQNIPRKKTCNESSNVTTGCFSVRPVHIALEGLRQLLLACKHEALMNDLDINGAWEVMALDQQPELIEGMKTFACCLVKFQSELIPKIISCLNPMISSLYSPQRILTATFFAEFIKAKCNDDLVLVDKLINCLVGRLMDTDPTVRRLCIRGLGNVSNCGQLMVQKYCSILLSALTGGLDDKDDTSDVISLEAMEGLSNLLKDVKEVDVRNVLITVALRIRPFFEKENSKIRAASLNLFGNLATFCSGEHKESFLEQIHSNLVTLVIHLDDSDTQVQQSSLHSLKKVGPLLGSKNMNELFQGYVKCGDSKEYFLFLKQFSKAIAEDFSEKLNYFVMGSLSYFKSFCPKIRGNAAVFLACFLSNLPTDNSVFVSKEQGCQALLSLLKDEEIQVRMKTVKAISLLHSI